MTETEKMEMKIFLHNEEYYLVRQVPGHGWCGIRKQIFHQEIVTDLRKDGIYGSIYCYNTPKLIIAHFYKWCNRAEPIGEPEDYDKKK